MRADSDRHDPKRTVNRTSSLDRKQAVHGMPCCGAQSWCRPCLKTDTCHHKANDPQQGWHAIAACPTQSCHAEKGFWKLLTQWLKAALASGQPAQALLGNTCRATVYRAACSCQ